jgi:hypothetical protein
VSAGQHLRHGSLDITGALPLPKRQKCTTV